MQRRAISTFTTTIVFAYAQKSIATTTTRSITKWATWNTTWPMRRSNRSSTEVEPIQDFTKRSATRSACTPVSFSATHRKINDDRCLFLVSPSHLVKLGFADQADFTEHSQINYLMRLALQKVAFLPFGYAMDKYRFALFRNQVDRKHELNSMWWALRVEHGGIMAAVRRSDANNFDAGAKFHVPSNTPYFRYFIAHILQFQFYRAMCRLKGHTGPLHMCDIYGRKDVGKKFREMLSMGNSKPWSEILESLTGETKLEPQALLDFFEPLHKWLKTENLARGYPVGWMPS